MKRVALDSGSDSGSVGFGVGPFHLDNLSYAYAAIHESPDGETNPG